MPLIIATIVRAIIQFGVTLGLVEIADRVVWPLLNRGITEVMTFFGVSEETAKDIIANEIFVFAEQVGIGALTLRTKIPTRIAEKLNFSAKGWKKRPISTTAANKNKNIFSELLKKFGVPQKIATGILTVTGGALAWNVLTDWVWIGNSLNILPGDLQDDIQKKALSIKQLIDAPKSIIYSAEKNKRSLSQQERELVKLSADEADKQVADMASTYSRQWVAFGRADVDLQMKTSLNALKIELQILRQMAGLIPRAAVKIAETVADVVTVFDGDTILINNGETVRLVGIDAPESTTSAGEKAKEYAKKRLEGKQVKIKSDPSAMTDIYGRRLGVVEIEGENFNIEMLKKDLAVFSEFEPNALVFKKQWKAAETESGGGTATSTPVKIFTGVLQQGVLGIPGGTIARESDLITSQSELQAAASQNIAGLWSSLASRIIYELKIQNSVITKDGTRRTGLMRQIKVGTLKNGQPKIKNITNKFAVIDVYIFTAKKIRSKIDTIILGPVDALAFSPTQIELDTTAKKIPEVVITSNTADIAAVVSPTPTLDIRTIEPAPAQQPAPQSMEIRPTPEVTAPVVAPVPSPVPSAPPSPATVITPSPAPSAPTVAIPTSTNPNRCNAQSIAEFFDPEKKQYPSVAVRGQHYQHYGFGSAEWFTGTTEQNNRLLAAYKKQINCQ